MLDVVRPLLGLAVVTVALLANAAVGSGARTPAASGPVVESWGHNGSVRLPNVQLDQLLEDQAGRIVGLGLYDNRQPLGSHATVVRLRANGTLDTSFGTDGVVKAPYRRYLGWTGGAVLGDGRIILAGTDRYGSTSPDAHVVLSMLDADGRVDTTFGSSGYVTVGAKGCVHGVTGVAGDTGGFVVGLLRACSITGAHTVSLDRFTLTGATATSFGTAGMAVLGHIPWQVVPQTPVIRLPDGAFIVASFGGQTGIRLAEVRSDGTRDSRFHSAATAVAAGPFGLRLTGLFRGKLGRLTVTGCSRAGPFLARFNRDGTPYRYWGGPAVGLTNVENFGGAFGAPCASFAQLPSYKLAVAGTALLRLYPSGILDPYGSIAPLAAFSPSASAPAHVLLAAGDGTVLVTSPVAGDTVIGRYR
jgi:uncharacterized delta-60 repeat protein